MPLRGGAPLDLDPLGLLVAPLASGVAFSPHIGPVPANDEGTELLAVAVRLDLHHIELVGEPEFLLPRRSIAPRKQVEKLSVRAEQVRTALGGLLRLLRGAAQLGVADTTR